jgi:hypothetical protein
MRFWISGVDLLVPNIPARPSIEWRFNTAEIPYATKILFMHSDHSDLFSDSAILKLYSYTSYKCKNPNFYINEIIMEANPKSLQINRPVWCFRNSVDQGQ